MIYITPRQAELLSYLTGRGPVGEWFNAPRTQIAEDTGISEYGVCQFMRGLVEKGCVERDELGLLRVIKRLEDRDVTEGMSPRPSKPKRRRKIRYSGFDPYQAAQFR